jgi:hypothetical protein
LSVSASALVILTNVRTQGCAALPCLALDPDFRQDDGIGVAVRRDGAAVCAGRLRRAGLAALRFPLVSLTQVRIQGCKALSCLALDPDFRQDDGSAGAVL